jgi:hypothetical protein
VCCRSTRTSSVLYRTYFHAIKSGVKDEFEQPWFGSGSGSE